jgi:hypothetical protein
MNNLRAAAQQALEALEDYERHTGFRSTATDALRAALAQQEQEQEPVAWGLFAETDGEWQLQYPVFVGDEFGKRNAEAEAAACNSPLPIKVRPLYTHPPRRETEQEQEQEPVAKYSDIVSDGGMDPRNNLEHPPRREKEQQADYPEEKLQAVAEYVSDKYHVWYGVAARDVEEVLRQSVRCGLVSGPPRREWQGLMEEEIDALFLPSGSVIPFYRAMARVVEQALKERNT